MHEFTYLTLCSHSVYYKYKKVFNFTNKDFSERTQDLNLDYFIGIPNKESELNPWGHWKYLGKTVAVPSDHDHFYELEDFMLSAGDISINIIDYSKFIQLNLKGLNGENNYLKSKNYNELHFNRKGYGLGWGNGVINGYRVSTHDGSAGLYYCHVILYHDKKMAIIIMANSADKNHVKGIYELRELIFKNRVK